MFLKETIEGIVAHAFYVRMLKDLLSPSFVYSILFYSGGQRQEDERCLLARAELRMISTRDCSVMQAYKGISIAI